MSSRSLKGKNVVLYFYPKADTPGCTKEACEFRDTSDNSPKRIRSSWASRPTPPKRKPSSRTKFDLPFTLLADADHKAAEDYGVWKEKSMYGKKYMGVERTTFVIDPEGKIKKIFPKVKVDGHAEGSSGRQCRSTVSAEAAAFPPRPFLGVGALIFRIDGDRVLLVERGKAAAGRLLVAAGRRVSKPAERLEDALVREVLEETGLDVEVGRHRHRLRAHHARRSGVANIITS